MEAADGPNIIVVMNESFSDLRDVGDFTTNEEFTPFIDGIREDYPSGTLYSSVFGNNTCSSEYEFLTGVPTAFSEKGSIMYQQYLKEGAPSLVSLLEAQNFRTVGIHPYRRNSYNRANAWEAFGFDETHFDEDFTSAWKVRKYISDRSFYKRIIDVYEENSDRPFFCYGISMRNHATYLSDYEGEVQLTGKYRGKYPDVDEYLSLLKLTDKDTKALIEYFSAVPDDTMIVFFGDHQPMIDKDFYSKLLGQDFSSVTVPENSKLYKIPYFVWTNYDADIEVPEEASINYLPNIILNAAGVAKNDWFNFTDEMFADYPIVTENFIEVNEKLVEMDQVHERLDEVKSDSYGHPYYRLKKFQLGVYVRALGRN